MEETGLKLGISTGFRTQVFSFFSSCSFSALSPSPQVLMYAPVSAFLVHYSSDNYLSGCTLLPIYVSAFSFIMCANQPQDVFSVCCEISLKMFFTCSECSSVVVSIIFYLTVVALLSHQAEEEKVQIYSKHTTQATMDMITFYPLVSINILHFHHMQSFG